MKWLDRLYLPDSLKGRAGRIREEMERGEFPRGIWVISIPIGEHDQLDIRKAGELRYHGLWERIPMIVGLAKSRSGAVELICRMSEDCFRERGDARLREFLTER